MSAQLDSRMIELLRRYGLPADKPHLSAAMAMEGFIRSLSPEQLKELEAMLKAKTLKERTFCII